MLTYTSHASHRLSATVVSQRFGLEFLALPYRLWPGLPLARPRAIEVKVDRLLASPLVHPAWQPASCREDEVVTDMDIENARIETMLQDLPPGNASPSSRQESRNIKKSKEAKHQKGVQHLLPEYRLMVRLFRLLPLALNLLHRLRLYLQIPSHPLQCV